MKTLRRLLYKYYAKHKTGPFFALVIKLFCHGPDGKAEWLKLCGLSVGEGTIIRAELSSFPEPYMVSLGKKVYVASGVSFMTHDGSLSWMRVPWATRKKDRTRWGKLS